MNQADARLRSEELRSQINYHAYRYYELDQPEVADAEYDAMVQELKQIEDTFPELITEDSPTQRVGSAPSALFAPVEHKSPMWSLDNAFDSEDLRAWGVRVDKVLGSKADFYCELKVDGAAVNLVYVDGKLATAATRGNGRVGEDITANVRVIDTIPKVLKGKSLPDVLEVRGEIFMPVTAFDKLNEELTAVGHRPFANPRNSAAGSLRQKDAAVTASRNLGMFCHGIGIVEGRRFRKHSELMEFVASLGLNVMSQSRSLGDLDEVYAFCLEWEAHRHDVEFEVDGAVVKVDDLDQRGELGYTSKSPRWAIAYKFPPEEKTTLLKGIMVHTGRTGAVTPFAMLEPVILSGARVSMATLHNEDEIKRKDIRIGDTVLVRRAGEVIPEVIGPVPSKRTGKEKKFKMPIACPECKTALVRPEGEKVWRCPNEECPSRSIEALFHFAGRGAMDIEGMGYKTLMALMDMGWVKDPGDIYSLTREQLLELPLFADKKADQLLASIEGSKVKGLTSVIVGLGIRHVGPPTARALASEFGSIDEIATASVERLMQVEEIGEVVATTIKEFFSSKRNNEIIDKLRAAGVKMTEERKAPTEGPLTGKSFVLTGGLESFSRDEAARLIEEAGGKVVSSVSKKTDYVVVGENPGSKLAKAQELGVPLLDEKALQALLP